MLGLVTIPCDSHIHAERRTATTTLVQRYAVKISVSVWLQSNISSAVHARHEAVKVLKRRSYGDKKMEMLLPCARSHQGRSDGGWGISVYIPPNQSTLKKFYVVTGCFFLFDPGQI